MALKSIVISDLSGVEVPDDQHATLIVQEHPALRGTPVRLDAHVAEVGKLQNTAQDLVTIVIHEANKLPRRVVIDQAALQKLYKDVNFDDLIEKAPEVRQEPEDAPRRRGRPAGGGTPKPKSDGPKINYTDPANAGQLHRGRVTDEEAAWVRDNQAAASANRERQSGKPIDFADPAEKKRYSIS